MALFPETNYDFPNVSNYDGDLRELLKYVKSLSDDYANIKNLAEEMERLYAELESQFAVLKAEVEDFREEIAAAVAESITVAMAEYAAQLVTINGRIDNTNATVEQLRRTIDNFTEMSREYTDTRVYALSELAFAAISDLQEQIDALQWELPDVYNITRGVTTDLVTLIYDVYDASRDNALTAGEFDVLGMTAAQFDGLQFTAYEFDTSAKSRLVGNKCRNPYTGELDTVCNIIQYIAQATTDQAITAGEFDAAELTNEEFNALNLTAYMFDFFAKQFIAA